MLKKRPHALDKGTLEALYKHAKALAESDDEFPFAADFLSIGQDTWRAYMNRAGINIRKKNRAPGQNPNVRHLGDE